MIYLAVLAFGVTLGLPIAVSSPQGHQEMRQVPLLRELHVNPMPHPRIQTAMIIGLALIELLVIYSLLMFFVFQAKLPTVKTLKTLIDTDAKQVATDVRSEN